MDSHLQRLREALATATRDMTAEELTHHPEGKWSTGEVLEHLYLTYAGTIKGCERCLAEGKPLAGVPSFKQRFSTLVVTEMGYFPSGRQAPERSRPRGTPAEKVLSEIGPQIAAMDELIGECEARYGKRTHVLDHPVLGPLTAAQWRKFHWVHGRHHVKQIERLRGTARAARPASG